MRYASPLRALATSQVSDLAELDASYKKYDEFLRSAGLRGSSSPRPRQCDAEAYSGLKLRPASAGDVAHSELKHQMAESVRRRVEADQGFLVYKGKPLGSDPPELPAPDEDAAVLIEGRQLEGDPSLPDDAADQLYDGVILARRSLARDWAACVAAEGPRFLVGDEDCLRLQLLRVELWSRNLIEEKYHSSTIDTALIRARYAVDDVANEDLPEEDREAEVLTRTEECIRLHSIKRRILDAEYRRRGIGQRRRDELGRQKVRLARAMAGYVRHAILTNASLMLVQERRLMLLDKHEKIEHWRQFIAFDCFDDRVFRDAGQELKEMSDVRDHTEARVRQLRFSLDVLQDYWAPARQDLLALGARCADPVEDAWAEARDRRANAIALAEAKVADIIEDRRRDIQAKLALLGDGDDAEGMAEAAEAGRRRAKEDKRSAAKAAQHPAPATQTALEARAATELRREVDADREREDGERLKPLPEDLERMQLPYDEPLSSPDLLRDCVSRGEIDLTTVYLNLCQVQCFKPNQQIANILGSSGSEHVDLSSVFVGRAVLPHLLCLLKFLPRLRRLSLSRCDVDNAQWKKLVPELQQMRLLTDLDISDNPALCDLDSVLGLLRHNWRLVTLRRRGITFFPKAGVQQLRDQLVANREMCAERE
eukprot:TRINITY_DN13774_c0_g1_i1.p1 TRINITY_DN13774_c0_g1~~TRINITY_DN13774_c0_g1_i1.p1  ORF type:complete len:654 (+),score=237.05 TRINITY_DN13774_c0_g1_i1:60-2021(+)